MQIYTLGAIRDELKALLGNRTDIDDTRYNRWINEAIVAMADELEFADTLSSTEMQTTAGEEVYLLPSGIDVLLSVSVVLPDDQFYGGEPLNQMDLKWFRQQATVSGTPEYWMVFNRYMTLWPTPDTTYTLILDSDNVAAELTLDSDLVPFRPAVSSLVLKRARWIGFDALGQPEATGIAQNSYITELRMRKDHIAKQQQGRSVRASVPRTDRQLRLGARGYRDGLRKSI